MHECWNGGQSCDCDGEDHDHDQPDDCSCPCMGTDDWPFDDDEPEVTDAPEWMPGA